jgi:hypothetical protein
VTDFESSSMRVSDADRESAMTVLGEHMSTGRLTVDEYGERAAHLSTAKTRADVLELFNDLPRPWPTFSGVDDEVVTPIPLAPTPAPTRRSHLGLAMIPLVPVSWVAAIVIAPATGHWVILLLPILLTVFGAVLLGRGVHRLGRRVVANFTEATGWVGPEYRDAMRDTMRDARRRQDARSGWNNEMLGQIGAEIQRGIRERGAYRHRHQHHHGRRRDW